MGLREGIVEVFDERRQRKQWECLQKKQKGYRKIFLKAYGPFPHPCYFNCGEEVKPWAGKLTSDAPVIHHEDHDQSNNAPENLKPAHHGCHLSHHHKGSTHPPEVVAKRTKAIQKAYDRRSPAKVAEDKARMASMTKKAWADPGSRARLVAERKERANRPDERARMAAMAAEARAANWQNPEYRAKASAGAKARMADPAYRAKAVANLEQTFEQRSARAKKYCHKLSQTLAHRPGDLQP